MKFSQSLDLAIHALVYIAHNSKDEPVLIRELAQAVRASESYLARVMLSLVKAGILKSIRGRNGGFLYRIPPRDITIADVVIAIDPDAAVYRCPWENRGCESFTQCPVLDLFCEAQRQMLAVLRRMNIGDIAASRDVECGREWLKSNDSESSHRPA